MKKIYLIAGEASGDMHGAALIRSLSALFSGWQFWGVGGSGMAAAGLKTLYPFEHFNVMGFSDVLKAYPTLKKYGKGLAERIAQDKPEAVVFIDYPGFNLRLGQLLRKKGYNGKLIQLVAPSVWAWKKGRVKVMAETLDLLLSILPFEPPCFSSTSLKTIYVGNPSMQLLHEPFDAEWRTQSGIPKDIPLLALFPGSRPDEFKRNFPLQMQAAEAFRQKHSEYGLAIASPPAAFNNIKAPLAPRSWVIAPTNRYHLMRDARCAIAKSGTVALELALLGCPSVVAYRLSQLNYFLARYIFRIRMAFYSLPNILLKEALFPEFYDVHISENALVHALEKQLARPAWIKEKKQQLEKLLTSKNAIEESAQEILRLCNL